MTAEIVNESSVLDQIAAEIIDIQNKIVKVAELFSRLSSEGIKKAKKRFKMVLSGSIIDRLAASGKSGYPSHMIMKAGIDVGVWRLLEPEAKTLAANKSATVYLKVQGRSDPVIKTIDSLTGPEIKQVFRPKFKGQVPVESQIPIPPPADKKQIALPKGDMCDFEEVATIVASGTEFVIIKGSRGGIMKCHIKVLKNVIK